MLKPEVRSFLEAPHVARLSVVDVNGYPHTVPLWYAVDGDDIVMISDRTTRKVEFLGANSKASICIGGGEGADTAVAAGYLFKGDCTAQEDADHQWLRLITHRYRSPAQAEKDIAQWSTELDIIVLRLRVAKVIKVY
jgi:predicted pyridoxine 5'-phosphate oxidase superfamily flavin-nucleotide-binding protein